MTGVTQRGSPACLMAWHVQGSEAVVQANPGDLRLRADGDPGFRGKRMRSCCREKHRREDWCRPYPKPTQVVR